MRTLFVFPAKNAWPLMEKRTKSSLLLTNSGKHCTLVTELPN